VLDGRVEGAGLERVAHAVIVKDAGDDPDATHGAHLTADVRWLPQRAGEIALQGGAGVGIVTREGLGLAVDGPAINPVPQRNIRDNVRAVAGDHLAVDGLEVTISVPGGEAMAKKTLNARLGILERHLDPRHHRHRPAVLDRCLPRQRRAGGRCGGEAGADQRRVHHRRAQREIRHAPVADARRGLLRADG
jgi:hypothetical protein